MNFYLGTHEPSWLAKAGVPLFISRRRLARNKGIPVAAGRWALDSGGFTELNQNGRWSIGPRDYAEEVRRYRDGIGQLDWAAIQDWMCEPFVLEKTGRSIVDHQALTVQSYMDLRQVAPDLPWCPVLQGWKVDDYLRHADDYRRAGVDLAALPIVGVGSVCRRQGTSEVVEIFASLKALGLNLHGFGLKILGLRRSAGLLASADSLAWSRRARFEEPLAGCRHSSCANCIRYALGWRDMVVEVANPSSSGEPARCAAQRRLQPRPSDGR